jgi:hypothetical protein
VLVEDREAVRDLDLIEHPGEVGHPREAGLGAGRGDDVVRVQALAAGEAGGDFAAARSAAARRLEMGGRLGLASGWV